MHEAYRSKYIPKVQLFIIIMRKLGARAASINQYQIQNYVSYLPLAFLHWEGFHRLPRRCFLCNCFPTIELLGGNLPYQCVFMPDATLHLQKTNACTLNRAGCCFIALPVTDVRSLLFLCLPWFKKDLSLYKDCEQIPCFRTAGKQINKYSVEDNDISFCSCYFSIFFFVGNSTPLSFYKQLVEINRDFRMSHRHSA